MLLDQTAETKPLVSVVITSYNRAKLIGRAIESALMQDYSNLEIIISDNCSTDDSLTVIKRYLNDPRIKFSQNSSNIGMSANFQKSFFELASGEYITNISSDDYLNDPSFISDGIRLMTDYKDVHLCFGRYQMLYEKKNRTEEYPLQHYYETKFRTGKQAFVEYAKYPCFNWAGCIMDRRQLIKLEIFFSDNTSLCADMEANFALMFTGNVVYINRLAYTVYIHALNFTGSTRNYVDYVNYINVYETYYTKYIKTYGEDNEIIYWKKRLLEYNTYTIARDLLIKSRVQHKNFMFFLKVTYPEYYLKIKKKRTYKISKHLLLPFIINKPLRKIASIFFPGKTYFKKDYQYQTS